MQIKKVKIIYFFDEYEFITKDVDNYYKVLIDSLKKTLIMDDKFIEELVILKKRTNKLYPYISVYIEDYNAEEIYYIPEKIGEMPELVIEKMEILEDKNVLGAEDLNLEVNNSKSELTKEKTQISLGSNEYFKELKQKYDQTCSKLKVPNNRYSALKNVFLIELEKIKDNKEMFEENFLKFIEETPKFVNTDLFVTKYSGRSKQFNIKNFNRKRANNFLRTGFGYAFDKSHNFKKV